MAFEFSHDEYSRFTKIFTETYFDSEAVVAIERRTHGDGTKTYIKRYFKAPGRMVEDPIEAAEAESLINNQTQEA